MGRWQPRQPCFQELATFIVFMAASAYAADSSYLIVLDALRDGRPLLAGRTQLALGVERAESAGYDFSSVIVAFRRTADDHEWASIHQQPLPSLFNQSFRQGYMAQSTSLGNPSLAKT